MRLSGSPLGSIGPGCLKDCPNGIRILLIFSHGVKSHGKNNTMYGVRLKQI